MQTANWQMANASFRLRLWLWPNAFGDGDVQNFCGCFCWGRMQNYVAKGWLTYPLSPFPPWVTRTCCCIILMFIRLSFVHFPFPFPLRLPAAAARLCANLPSTSRASCVAFSPASRLRLHLWHEKLLHSVSRMPTDYCENSSEVCTPRICSESCPLFICPPSSGSTVRLLGSLSLCLYLSLSLSPFRP